MAIRDAILVSKLCICCAIIYFGISVYIHRHVQRDPVMRRLEHLPGSRPVVQAESEIVRQLKQAAQGQRSADILEEISVERDVKHDAQDHEAMPQWQVRERDGAVVNWDQALPTQAGPDDQGTQAYEGRGDGSADTGTQVDRGIEAGPDLQQDDSEARRKRLHMYEEFLKKQLQPKKQDTAGDWPQFWQGVQPEMKQSDRDRADTMGDEGRSREHRSGENLVDAPRDQLNDKVHVPSDHLGDTELSGDNLGHGHPNGNTSWLDRLENTNTSSDLDNMKKALPTARASHNILDTDVYYNAQGALIHRYKVKTNLGNFKESNLKTDTSKSKVPFAAQSPNAREIVGLNEHQEAQGRAGYENAGSLLNLPQNTSHYGKKTKRPSPEHQYIRHEKESGIQNSSRVIAAPDSILNMSEHKTQKDISAPKQLPKVYSQNSVQYYWESGGKKALNSTSGINKKVITNQQEVHHQSIPEPPRTTNNSRVSLVAGKKKKRKKLQILKTNDRPELAHSDFGIHHNYSRTAGEPVGHNKHSDINQDPMDFPRNKTHLPKRQHDAQSTNSSTKVNKRHKVAYKMTLSDTCSFPVISIDPLLDDMIDNRQKIELPTLNNYQNPCWYERLAPDFQMDYRTDVHMFPDQALRSFRNIIPVYNSRKEMACAWRLRCLPLIYIIGVAKSGTSDLHSTLMSHPHVMKGATKEPFFWDTTRWKRDATISDYLNLYDEVAESIRENYVRRNDGGRIYPYHPIVTIDASVNALFNFDGSDRVSGNAMKGEPRYIAAHLIKNITPNAKVILIIRNPTERLFSSYIFYNTVTRPSPISAREFHIIVVDLVKRLTECFESRPLGDCLYDEAMTRVNKTVTLHAGVYYGYIRKWIEVFPDMQIIRTEDYKVNRTGIYNGLIDYIGLEPRQSQFAASDNIVGKGPERTFKMWPKTRTIVDDFYRPFNRMLAELLHDDRFLFVS